MTAPTDEEILALWDTFTDIHRCTYTKDAILVLYRRARADGIRDVKEVCARKILFRVSEIYGSCESLGCIDPTTGLAECINEVNGKDCLCADKEEFAEDNAKAIRALEIK